MPDQIIKPSKDNIPRFRMSLPNKGMRLLGMNDNTKKLSSIQKGIRLPIKWLMMGATIIRQAIITRNISHLLLFLPFVCGNLGGSFGGGLCCLTSGCLSGTVGVGAGECLCCLRHSHSGHWQSFGCIYHLLSSGILLSPVACTVITQE